MVTRRVFTPLISATKRAADLLGVVVLEPDGSIVPVAYGFSRRFRICDINKERFANAWPGYAVTDYAEFRRLCRAALDKISSSTMPQLFNWHDLIVQQNWPGILFGAASLMSGASVGSGAGCAIALPASA
jgi:hypothetical protein